jgi:hypothetical protein
MQYCLRIPRDAYEDALDIARVFDMSLNQFFLQAIRCYVDAQKKQEVIRLAVAQSREARRAGLASIVDEETAAT